MRLNRLKGIMGKTCHMGCRLDISSTIFFCFQPVLCETTVCLQWKIPLVFCYRRESSAILTPFLCVALPLQLKARVLLMIMMQGDFQNKVQVRKNKGELLQRTQSRAGGWSRGTQCRRHRDENNLTLPASFPDRMC